MLAVVERNSIFFTADFSQKQEPTPPSHQTARGHDPNATPTITRSRCSDVTRPQPDMLGQKSESTTGTVKQESGAVLETRTERVVRSSSVYYVPSGHAHAHSVSSKDDFQTPPSSPRLEDTESEEEAPRSLGRVCVECTEMKEKNRLPGDKVRNTPVGQHKPDLELKVRAESGRYRQLRKKADAKTSNISRR